ncbi:barstar family protein [Streptomyces sp. NBC_01233]|uniref:barstar family protein n=1 Tax=Streptomyces sp. NBC_01233 TaxID=2903787 RepID=UPI002E0EF809|nr:barstar family protein [Streptomyces sp. NBC_01233]
MKNPWHERWSRERGTPLRYVLVEERDHGPEGRSFPYACGYDLLAKCADVEGLFTEPPVPAVPGEELVLFSCAPLGPLREAVDGKDGGRIGDMLIEVRLGGEKVHDWDYELCDAVVVDQQPSPEDASLVDIALEAGVRPPSWSFGTPSDERQKQFGFELFDPEGDTPYGSCAAVPRLFHSRRPPEAVVLRLLGCDPDAPLLSRGHGSTRLDILAVDRTGRVMTGRTAWLSVVEARPSALGGGLLDVTVSGEVEEQPRPELEPVWQAWLDGRPTEPNQWARFPDELRGEWLRFTEMRHGPDRKGGAYHLDGRHVTGHYALYCALGEALNGPGGYYGRCWNSLFDCLSGGFGALPPFTLVWHDFEVAHRALAGEGMTAGSYAEEVVGRLRAFGATMELR